MAAAARLATARGDDMRAASMEGPLLCRGVAGMVMAEDEAGGGEKVGSTALSLYTGSADE